MVGVPKSKGCQTCIKRRVKCDLVRPNCTQCRKYGVECPGYIKLHKFINEGPQLGTRFTKKPEPTPESIDERIAPSLVSRSMGKQQPVIFGDFVMASFTRWFGLNRYRVHVPWTTYVAQHGGKSPAFDAAVYSMNLVFMGYTHVDDKLQRSSQEMYSKALRLFGDRIRDEAAMKSRESVSITIVLSLFEAYSPTNPDSWAHHAGGTALLMAHRGPKAHLTGFDRCLYLSFRSFIVAEAFLNDKHCIFERPEWQAHVHQVRREDMADPRVDGPIALFIDLQDRIFIEVAKIPGLLFESRRLRQTDNPEQTARQLSARALSCSQVIYTFSAHLRLAAAVQKYQWCKPNDKSGTQSSDKSPFIGPIPSTFPQEFANSVLRGSDICRYLLGLLVDYLDGYKANTQSCEKDQTENVDSLPFHFVSKVRGSKNSNLTPIEPGGPEKDLPSPNKWLDLVAASMGLEAFDIITYPTRSRSPELVDDQWDAALAVR
ncbi:uncharacterized protein N7511_010522 [Penicillium nucicola]|uniref:uncharacterized protein n=1 Tax=Penicillium nucicola TaxID=1850975 RepID=UPI0025451E0C|nr:uncharacterized protein N7511_010522 [Penicillium nucicola]KAJ5748826.1 hypothetical protein N7511_010522 [Penicillium nucicola]